MTVVLKKSFHNDRFIKPLNEELTRQYGSNTGNKFNTWGYLHDEAEYLNNHPLGITQVPHIKRPITKEYLHQNFFWYRYANFSFKLSGGGSNSDEARNAIAVCKWIIQTNRQYIDQSKSSNYQSRIVKEYLDHYFEDTGYNIEELWKLPLVHKK